MICFLNRYFLIALAWRAHTSPSARLIFFQRELFGRNFAGLLRNHNRWWSLHDSGSTAPALFAAFWFRQRQHSFEVGVESNRGGDMRRGHRAPRHRAVFFWNCVAFWWDCSWRWNQWNFSPNYANYDPWIPIILFYVIFSYGKINQITTLDTYSIRIR